VFQVWVTDLKRAGVDLLDPEGQKLWNWLIESLPYCRQLEDEWFVCFGARDGLGALSDEASVIGSRDLPTFSIIE
jgi:hypothetical protein